jgi:hypothetical protein
VAEIGHARVIAAQNAVGGTRTTSPGQIFCVASAGQETGKKSKIQSRHGRDLAARD